MKVKIQVLSHTGHISSAQEPHVANGYCREQRRVETLPSQKVLLDGTTPDP